MKITKYPQSCILIETLGKKILIDPGMLVKEINDFTDIDVILITHKHGDHCYLENIQKIKEKSPRVRIFGNKKVQEELGIEIIITKKGDKIDFQGVKIEVTDANHGIYPGWPEEKIIKENNGFIIDDGTTRIYHTGDTINFPNDYKADIVIVPISAHAIVMDPEMAALFCKQREAKLAIPNHYDHPQHPKDPEEFAKEAKKLDLKYKILQNGEKTEV